MPALRDGTLCHVQASADWWRDGVWFRDKRAARLLGMPRMRSLQGQTRRPVGAAAALLTIGSLFSGVGGLDLGLERAGLGPVLFQVEIDPFCRPSWPVMLYLYASIRRN